jgi:hypothetical protein
MPVEGILIGQGADVITLHSAVTSFVTPTASGGADISKWRRSGAAPQMVTIRFSASTNTDIPGPIGVYGERDDGTISLVGSLNLGADIIIPNSSIGIEYMANVGGFKKIQIGTVATAANLTGFTSTPSNSAQVTVTATPLVEVIQP